MKNHKTNNDFVATFAPCLLHSLNSDVENLIFCIMMDSFQVLFHGDEEYL